MDERLRLVLRAVKDSAAISVREAVDARQCGDHDEAAELLEEAHSLETIASDLESGRLRLVEADSDPEQALLAEREAHADTRALVERMATAIREAVRMDRLSAALVEADEALAKVRQ